MSANGIALVMSGVLILIGGGVFGWLMHAWHSYRLEEKRFIDDLNRLSDDLRTSTAKVYTRLSQ